ncbi:MAG: copper-translocating P-type ATPase [Bacteroidetes bacterium]|nr:MAG: copper-translocating P-type ATPase [Bacteroidota bacterium]
MGQVHKTFPVLEMSCAACAVSVESIVAGQPGVSEASVNYANQSLTVTYDNSQTNAETLQQAVQSIGYDLIISEENASEEQAVKQQEHYHQILRDTIGAGILALPVFLLGMFFPDFPNANLIMMALAAPVVFGFGRRFFIHAWKQARHLQANMDTLVALSTGIAFLFSTFNTLNPDFWQTRGLEAHVYFEAAAVVVFFILLGKMLEERAKASTSSAIKKLMGLQPNTVILVNPDGQKTETPIAAVRVGDRILVRPGAKIPVDGKVASGASFVDESMVSGEPMAVQKTPGAIVFAGTLNQKGSFEFIAEKVGAATLLARIIEAVKQAQSSKAPIQKLVDRIAAIFVPAVLLIAVLTFTAWMVLGGASALTHALLTSVTVLVIACPCALGLATPTAIIAGVGRGAELGILIKDAQSLETAHRVSAVVLDKTGTLTVGQPQLSGQHWWTEKAEYLKSVVYSIESHSEHPLALAITEAFTSSADTEMQVKQFQSITGKGVQAIVDGKHYSIGSPGFITESGVNCPAEADQVIASWTEEGRTVIAIAEEQALAALFSIHDPLKPDSLDAVQALKRSGRSVYLLSGDAPRAVEVIASQLDLGEAKGGLLPADKAGFIRNLQEQGHVVAMVGDGINDAEALAQADVSIAMGKGSDIAIETANMALVSSSLQQVPKALLLSSKTVRTIRQNLFWAFIYNVIGIPLAAGILYPVNGFLLNPMIAGAAMALSSVSVVSNSLRLRKAQL